MDFTRSIIKMSILKIVTIVNSLLISPSQSLSSTIRLFIPTKITILQNIIFKLNFYMGYSFSDIEQKWQKFWDEHNTFRVTEDFSKPKMFILDMYRYPSGAGLHVGHPEGYTATDIYSRFKKLRGYNVLHPMGFDSFGLPAENYAIQTGTHPSVTTYANIDRFRDQIK